MRVSSWDSLLRIMRFGLIKVVPGVFNLALIPYLLVVLGAEAYGLYSIWLGYVVLVANTIAAIVAQPMYRYLSSRPDDRNLFAGFAIVAACIAGLVSFGVTTILGIPSALSIGFAGLAMGTVMGTAAVVDFTIVQKIGRIASFEGLRILTILVVLAVPTLRGTGLELTHVVFGLAISNILPLLVTVRGLRPGVPRFEWLRECGRYGTRSAAWLLLAGFPVVGAKTILLAQMSNEGFGTYTAIADLTYRGFAIANAALMMWAFPLMSRQFDAGKLDEVRQTLRFALLVYGVGGIVTLLGILGSLYFLPIEVSTLPCGVVAVVTITGASFVWHGMSISHKPLEMTLRTARMAVFMAIAVGAFFTLTYSLIALTEWNAFYIVTLTMIGVGATYAIVTFSQRLES